jgi:hypothetical protein
MILPLVAPRSSFQRKLESSFSGVESQRLDPSFRWDDERRRAKQKNIKATET